MEKLNAFSSGIKMVLGLALTTVVSTTSFAHGPERRLAFQQCEQQVTDGKVVDKSQLSSAQRESIHQCMKQKFQAFHQAVAACMGGNMPAFQPGQRPQLDPATKAALHVCRDQVKASQQSGAQPASTAN